MAVGDLITAARFNNLQSRINTILGNGSGTDGYGQTLQSSQVLSNAIVTADDVADLYVDMTKARVHQEGVLPSTILPVDADDLILDGGTGPYNPKSIAAYEDLMLDIETDRFVIAQSQATLSPGITSTRTTSWNGTLVHEVTITFNDSEHRRHFFNSGGEFRLSTNITGGRELKTNDWRTILSNVGTVIFDYNSTQSTGSGIGSALGNYQLSSSYTKIFEKVGSDVNAAYAENSFTIYAKAPSSERIMFLIEYVDRDSGDPPIVPVPAGGIPGGVDENVDGTITSTVQVFRATGNYVEVDAPSFFNTTPL